MMIKGITVKLTVKTQSSVDSLNRPIYTTTTKSIDNVLVGQPSDDEIINTLNLTGRKAVYVLGIPKGNTDNWEDTEVEFFGKKWRTIGMPTQGIEEMIPLSWNMKVKVERVE